jgi:hypothetical protein
MRNFAEMPSMVGYSLTKACATITSPAKNQKKPPQKLEAAIFFF